MKSNNLLFVLLPVVFFLGFLGGMYWQTLMIRSAMRSVPRSPAEVQAPSVIVQSAPPSSAEEGLSQALEDPDFRRVHDFLMRDNPIQMNLEIPEKTESTNGCVEVRK